MKGLLHLNTGDKDALASVLPRGPGPHPPRLRLPFQTLPLARRGPRTSFSRRQGRHVNISRAHPARLTGRALESRCSLPHNLLVAVAPRHSEAWWRVVALGQGAAMKGNLFLPLLEIRSFVGSPTDSLSGSGGCGDRTLAHRVVRGHGYARVPSSLTRCRR